MDNNQVETNSAHTLWINSRESSDAIQYYITSGGHSSLLWNKVQLTVTQYSSHFAVTVEATTLFVTLLIILPTVCGVVAWLSLLGVRSLFHRWCCTILRYSLREHTSNHFSKCSSLSFLLWKTLSSSSAQPESPRVRSLWKSPCAISQPWFNFHQGADYRGRWNYRTTIIKPGWLSRCQELNYSNYLYVQRLLSWEAWYWNYWEKIFPENLCYVSVP